MRESISLCHITNPFWPAPLLKPGVPTFQTACNWCRVGPPAPSAFLAPKCRWSLLNRKSHSSVSEEYQVDLKGERKKMYLLILTDMLPENVSHVHFILYHFLKMKSCVVSILLFEQCRNYHSFRSMLLRSSWYIRHERWKYAEERESAHLPAPQEQPEDTDYLFSLKCFPSLPNLSEGGVSNRTEKPTG